MSLALIVVLAVYAVYVPGLFYALYRHSRPAHRRKLRVPGELDFGTLLLTSDSDYVGLV